MPWRPRRAGVLESRRIGQAMGNFDFEAGRRFLQEGEMEEAIRCFLASLDLDPGHVEGYVELFRAYELAWSDSGDPVVLDQMRKVAVAGLKRSPDGAQRRVLQEGLDRTEERILAIQQAEQEADGSRPRRLPLIAERVGPGRGRDGA
ncbi:MAG: hypothetical protein ACE5JG_12775 [Planctomycetota bacterium]